MKIQTDIDFASALLGIVVGVILSVAAASAMIKTAPSRKTPGPGMQCAVTISDSVMEKHVFIRPCRVIR